MEYGEKIKEIRKLKNLNQVEFANLIDIGVATLSAYETGRTTPNIDFLRRLAEKCGVSPSWFLDIEEQKAPKTYGDIMDIVLILETLLPAKVIANHKRFDEHAEFACLCFMDENLTNFISDYKKIHRLYLDNTIPKDLYITWIKQKREELKNIHIEHQLNLTLIDDLESATWIKFDCHY